MKKVSPLRFLALGYLLFLLGFLPLGCTTKEEPNEVLVMCGNHSCGNLVMVTTDTSSDGFQYLEPVQSPDGNSIAFTCDWQALPSTDRPPDPLPTNRQIALMPTREGTQPENSLTVSGAVLVSMLGFPLSIGGNPPDYFQVDERQKGGPIWLDNSNLILWIQLPRGNRLFRVNLSTLPVIPEPIYFESSDSDQQGGFWQHMQPAISPDRRWLAFSRFGCQSPDILETCTSQSIWVLDMQTAGINRPNVVFPVTTTASRCGGPTWSPDGRTIAFHASTDLVGISNDPGTEIFHVAFDTTGLAASGSVPLNQDLRRLTYTDLSLGDPITGIDNLDPSYNRDGSSILFVSTRRAPSITLRRRAIWRIPADGRIDPEIHFFSREDDVDPTYSSTASGEIVLSSSMGFPTEMLDRLEQEAYERIVAEHPDVSETAARTAAREEREELEFFAGVMSHIYIYSP